MNNFSSVEKKTKQKQLSKSEKINTFHCYGKKVLFLLQEQNKSQEAKWKADTSTAHN